MIIKKEQIEALRPYMKNVDELVAADSLYDFEVTLDALIADIGFDDNDEINETGLFLQRLYDEIANMDTLEMNKDG